MSTANERSENPRRPTDSARPRRQCLAEHRKMGQRTSPQGALGALRGLFWGAPLNRARLGSRGGRSADGARRFQSGLTRMPTGVTRRQGICRHGSRLSPERSAERRNDPLEGKDPAHRTDGPPATSSSRIRLARTDTRRHRTRPRDRHPNDPVRLQCPSTRCRPIPLQPSLRPKRWRRKLPRSRPLALRVAHTLGLF